MAQFHRLALFLAFLLLHVSLSTSFPQPSQARSRGKGEKQVEVGSEGKSNSNSGGEKAAVVSRQDEDEDDDGDDAVDNATRVKVVNGVGNILTGALSLNPVKVLQGAFGFADSEIQDNILNVILGHAPPSANKNSNTPRPTTPKPEPEVTEAPAEQIEIRTRPTTVSLAKHTRVPTTTLKSRKTVKPQQLPGQEDDEDYL